MSVIRISESLQEELRSMFSARLRTNEETVVIFRRISNVEYVRPPKHNYVFSPEKEKEPVENLGKLTPLQRQKNVETLCPQYKCCVKPIPIRVEPKELKGKQISLLSSHRCDLNQFVKLPLKDTKFNKNQVPMNEDLVLISVKKSALKNKNKFVIAASWAVCSEQFLRAWTAMFYEEHDSFDAISRSIARAVTPEEYEERLRKRLFSGNRLMSNNWLKHKLGHSDQGTEFSSEESDKIYWHLRSEFCSRRWVDVWPALVLMIRYGELPCSANLPNNLDDSPKRLRWDLPPLLISNLLSQAISSLKAKGDAATVFFDNHIEYAQTLIQLDDAHYSNHAAFDLSIFDKISRSALVVTHETSSEPSEQLEEIESLCNKLETVHIDSNHSLCAEPESDLQKSLADDPFSREIFAIKKGTRWADLI